MNSNVYRQMLFFFENEFLTNFFNLKSNFLIRMKKKLYNISVFKCMFMIKYEIITFLFEFLSCYHDYETYNLKLILIFEQ